MTPNLPPPGGVEVLLVKCDVPRGRDADPDEIAALRWIDRRVAWEDHLAELHARAGVRTSGWRGVGFEPTNSGDECRDQRPLSALDVAGVRVTQAILAPEAGPRCHDNS